MATTQSNEKDDQAAAAVPTHEQDCKEDVWAAPVESEEQNVAAAVPTHEQDDQNPEEAPVESEEQNVAAAVPTHEQDDQIREEAPVQSEEQNVAGGRRPKFTHGNLSSRLAINLPREEFEKLPTRVDQIEYILDKEGFKVQDGLLFFERAMMPKQVKKPKLAKLQRQEGEDGEDYHKRAKDHFGKITKFTETILYRRDKTHSLRILSAPHAQDNPWGFQRMEKQEDTTATQHLFCRVELMEQVKRSIYELESSSRGEAMISVLWLGASGIGKSLSLVNLLVQLVRRMKHGHYVGFHSADVLTIYSKEEDGTLKKHQKELKFSDLGRFGFAPLKDDFIMLVDPPETVGDYRQFCPTLIALSSRLEEHDLKTFRKSAVSYLAVDPPSEKEVEAIATCVSATTDTISYEKIMSRYKAVGANLRIILSGTDKPFDDLLTDINNTKCDDLLEEAKDVNALRVPKHYKYFVAPYNNPELEQQDNKKKGLDIYGSAKNAKFHAWSDFTAEKLRLLAVRDAEGKLMQSLARIGLPYVVEENAIQSFLLKGDGTADWDWYDNVLSGTTVNKRTTNPPTLRPKGVVRFEGRYFRANLSTLKVETLYKSSGWQMVLGDFFTVQNKEDNSGRIVYMIQVSSRDPLEHPFKIEQYEKWRGCLQMTENDEIVIIYTTNKKHKKLHGLKFQDKNCDDVPCPCTGYIVRTMMTPGADVNELVISDEDADQSDWTEDAGAKRKYNLPDDWKVESKMNGKNKKYKVSAPGGRMFNTMAAAKRVGKKVGDARKRRSQN